MKFIFVDEVSGVADKKLFGIALVMIDGTKYAKMAESFLAKLAKHSWPQNIEFKGRYLFTRNPAGQVHAPEDMILMTEDIVNWLSEKKNARGPVYFVYNRKGNSADNYCYLLDCALKKIQKASGGAGKNLISVYLDEDNKLKGSLPNINESSTKTLRGRGYILVEGHVGMVSSTNYTPGICYSDVLAYICRWVVENPTLKSLSLLDLIESPTEKKASKAHDIYSKVKNIKIYDLDA